MTSITMAVPLALLFAACVAGSAHGVSARGPDAELAAGSLFYPGYVYTYMYITKTTTTPPNGGPPTEVSIHAKVKMAVHALGDAVGTPATGSTLAVAVTMEDASIRQMSTVRSEEGSLPSCMHCFGLAVCVHFHFRSGHVTL